MRRFSLPLLSALVLSLVSACRTAAPGEAPPPAEGPLQTEADEYTRYELLAPDSHKFRITHEVAATTPGATAYYALVRGGVFVSSFSARDLFTGTTLPITIVRGSEARENGHPAADPADAFFRIDLARPVPVNGVARLCIQVTYDDPRTYEFAQDEIVFRRVLGVKRICVVLPHGYEVNTCNYPVQILSQPDGRLQASFINPGRGAVPFEIFGRKIDGDAAEMTEASLSPEFDVSWVETAEREARSASSKRPARAPIFILDERAHQDRELVWDLEDPATNAFSLHQECTVTGAGTSTWTHAVREGLTAFEPRATLLDTGEPLAAEILPAQDALAQGIDLGERAAEASEVVVVRLEPLAKNATQRLRVQERYVDAGVYGVDAGELYFHNDFSDAHNRVILPKGWYAASSPLPVRVSTTADGRTQLDYVNACPGAVSMTLRARAATGRAPRGQ
ncbi:MAG: hypothetical protein ACKVWV_15615, partial [Planctomycetota bacterium]